MQIIRDTREKKNKGWLFEIYECELEIAKLDTGDYSIAGHEDKICIERKASTSEIANNLVGKKRDAFFRELQRMEEFDEAYLICEFTLDRLLMFPEESGIPRKLWYKKNKQGKRVRRIRMSGKYIYSILKNKSEEHGFELMFCNGSPDAESKCYEILKEYEAQFKTKR